MKKLNYLVLASPLLAAMLHVNTACAQNGTWINPNGGSWADSANWQGGIIAQGADSTANFSTLSLSADATVTLDGAQTIGNLIFGDQAGAHNWFLNSGTGGPLTFSGSSGPTTITVSNRSATIGATLAGTQGLTQNGNGTLILVEPIGYEGGTTNNAGTFELLSNLGTSNNATYSDPLVINGGVVESAATLNLDVVENDDSGSLNVIGAGTLQLVGTENGTNSPDLFFGPDAYKNYYYGADLAAGTLDLGANQRYIFALTEHNSVAQYDPNEDARIDANIIGSGGITYIAQNTYTGGSPMECPLVLNGVNTFTGEVEIQRGSIYLFTPQALAQTNKLLFDPVSTNNARLFLYGHGATVADLESSGTGNPLIANGNINNPETISPATLLVDETSNTVFGGIIVDGQYEYDAGDNPPGSLSLVKTGPGTLTLTGANTYSGSTSNEQGGLVISAAQSGGGPFSLADGTLLGITNINGTTVTMSDLALGISADTTLDFTFSGKPIAFQAPITTTSLEANGPANSVTINISVNGTGIPVGQFPLIQYTDGIIGGSGAGFGAFKLGALPPAVVASLFNNTASNSIDLLVTTGTATPSENGTWSNPSGGSWANSANWASGDIASGIGYTADFSTLTLTANATVTLDSAVTIGNLVFGDQGNAHTWDLEPGSGGALTLRAAGTPSITVNNETTTINVPLTGTAGLNQNGNGTLVLAQPVGYPGGTTNNAGTLVLSGSLNTYEATPLSIATDVQSGGTLNLDVDQNSDAGSINVTGGGTLQLVSTSNGTNSPDLFFGPDAVANDYYGAAMAMGTLDLGASQRYIYALTEHNAVAQYDPYEDARIDANIIGAGGITYIAQNTWTGSTSMECPLVLAGVNTFTGELEIQRGSVYLFTSQALAQTNELLLDPASTNNARLFLYGNGATVANLESSGTGNALIANGNVNNPDTIAPATLTVNESSNTVFAGMIVDGQYEYDAGTLPPGPLSLLKTGSGTLTLTGANTYSGLTSSAAGELIISTSQTGGGPFSVGNGAALGVAGIDASSVAMSDLSLSNSTVEFSFAASPVSFQAPINTASLEVNGSANSVTINIYASAAGIPVGQFPLIQFTDGTIGGSGAGFSAFKLGILPPTVVATLVDNAANNSIDLKVTTGTGIPSQNGTWTNPSGGSWVSSGNWQGGNIANGIGFTADFSTLTLSANATVTLDGALSIGNLIFGDVGNAHNWFLNTGSGGPLTLRGNNVTPSITVNNQTATIGLALVGTQGLNQNGNGTLVLTQPVGYTGGTTNSAGTLSLLGSLSTYEATPLSVNTDVQSGGTLNLDVDQNSDAGSINVSGGGTLQLISNSNGTNSPDLFFGPDAVSSDYYGAALATTTLDLGASQRYIYANTGHNAIARYDPYEDARIDANIIGAGGLTYIAQNSWTNSGPMECQLVLAGANTFTGELEIQRGSIYLLNSQALVQSNKLLLDPSTTNNSRLFLYGNSSTVANLESGGTGNALIANGNPLNNFMAISAATLTVNQTSSTTFGGVLVDTFAEYDTGTFTSGNLSLVKNGPGTLTLSGANTYTGSTTINSGELIISSQQKGGGAFSLADGAALGITGIANNAVSMSDLALGVSANTTLAFAFSAAPSAQAPIKTATLEANGGANSVTLSVSFSAGAQSSLTTGHFPLIQYTSGSIGGAGAGFSAFHLGTLPSYLTATLVNNTANNSIDLNITSIAATAPAFSGGQGLTNGIFSLSFTGPTGANFSVLASTNLALTPLSAWTVVGTGTFGAGVTSFQDTSSTNYTHRFYLISTP
jgi:fibronectin-binding autotransporter adhesin